MTSKGRPKTFENNEALSKAQELFWEKGYEATSLSELINHMGISRQSLYNTFGNKHDLFIKCFETYVEDNHTQLKELFDSDKSAKKKLNELIKSVTTHAGSDKGCMISFTIQEMANKDEKVNSILNCKYHRNYDLFHQFFKDALKSEEIESNLSAKELADLLDSLLLSVTSLCKLPNRSSQIQNIFKVFLKQIKFK